MAKQPARRMKFFVKTSTNVIVFVQIYMDYGMLFYEKEWLNDKHFQRLNDSIKNIIHQELEKCAIKTDSRGSKAEWSVYQNNQLEICYKFRKNYAKDFIFLGSNFEGTSLNGSSGFKFCTYPVFHERLIISVSKFDDMMSTKESSCVGVSKYFDYPKDEITMSAERKKNSLSKIKMKMSLKETNESGTSSTKSKQDLPNIVSICKNFAHKRRTTKKRVPTDSDKEVKGLKSDILSEKIIRYDVHCMDCSDNTEKSDSPFVVVATSCDRNVESEERINMEDKSDIVVVDGDKAVEREEIESTDKSNMETGTDALTNDLNLSYEDFRNDFSKQCTANNCVSDRQSSKPSSTSAKTKRKLLENSSSRSLRLSKRQKNTTRVETLETDMQDKAECGKEKETNSLLACVKNSLNIDNYDEVCLDGISSVKDITGKQIRSIVRSQERDIRDIFEGKIFSTRHQEYKKGGQNRAQLAYNFNYGEFSEEQQEVITDTLRQFFCYKHSRYFDYILKVLVPETMLLILTVLERHTNVGTSK